MLDFIVDSDVMNPSDRSALAELKATMETMLRRASVLEKCDLECSLRIVSDSTIHELNRDYRDRDSATDVLAFSQREGEGVCPPEILGDVVISLETARKQATSSLASELKTLAAHGLCHLLGYDHNTDEEEEEMNAKVAELLAAI